MDHVEDEYGADMIMRIGVLTIAQGAEYFCEATKPGFHISGFRQRLDNEETEICLSTLRKKYLQQLTAYLGPEMRMVMNVANCLVMSIRPGNAPVRTFDPKQPLPPPTRPPYSE